MRLLAVLAALAWLAAGCPDDRLRKRGCSQDSECGSPASAWRCEPQNGECYCRTNEACPARQYCNPAGFCQDRAGCEKSADCLDASLFCDTSTGTCLLKGRCTSDLHCNLGEVCDLAKSTCVAGCRTNGDCPGTSCRCGDKACVCTGKDQAAIQACTVGVCDQNFCADESFCRFGEMCGVIPDAGTNRAQCFSDYDEDRRPYCANCTFGGGTDICGSGANYCLIDTRNAGNAYCGADCSEGQACPRGYGCSDVIVVSRLAQCGGGQPACKTNPDLKCFKDSDCKRGGTCVIDPGQTEGRCAGRCGIGEGQTIGFCTCQVDSDCAQQTCSAGECSISRKKCVNPSDCNTVRCVDFNGGGGCLIGQNCAPEDGLSCLEVQ